MTPQLLRHAHRLEIPHDNGAIDATRSKIIALSVETQTCRMAGADRIGDVLRIILEQVVVGEKQVHVVEFMLVVGRGSLVWNSRAMINLLFMLCLRLSCVSSSGHCRYLRYL